MSERFKSEFGNYGAAPVQMDFEELQSLNIFTKEQFETRLNKLNEELVQRAGGGEIDYRSFIEADTFEEKAVRAYLVAFIVTEGRANVRTDPLTEKIFISSVVGQAGPETKSVAIEII
jgi:hypothetical protein